MLHHMTRNVTMAVIVIFRSFYWNYIVTSSMTQYIQLCLRSPAMTSSSVSSLLLFISLVTILVYIVVHIRQTPYYACAQCTSVNVHVRTVVPKKKVVHRSVQVSGCINLRIPVCILGGVASAARGFSPTPPTQNLM